MSLNWIVCFSAWARRGGSNLFQAGQISFLGRHDPSRPMCSWACKTLLSTTLLLSLNAPSSHLFSIHQTANSSYQTPLRSSYPKLLSTSLWKPPLRIPHASSWRHVVVGVESWDGERLIRRNSFIPMRRCSEDGADRGFTCSHTSFFSCGTQIDTQSRGSLRNGVLNL